MLADGAYDEAVQGAKYVMHIASGTIHGDESENDFDAHFIQPALKGTLSILDAANKTTTVKRIVITSSEVAIVPWEEFIQKEVDTVFDDTYEAPYPAPPYNVSFEAYAAGKKLALISTKDFVRDKKPLFDIIHILPAFVVGDNELVTDPKKIADATVRAAWAQVLGEDSGWGAIPSTSIHVWDVANLHVKALDPKIEGGQNFLAVSEGAKGTVWGDAIDIVNRNFPEAVKKGILPNTGFTPTKRTKIDASRTEKVFGIKFLSYEEQVKSVAKQYLTLLGEPVA
jgi:nucleoside-diphosphate-sugar epimerase